MRRITLLICLLLLSVNLASAQYYTRAQERFFDWSNRYQHLSVAYSPDRLAYGSFKMQGSIFDAGWDLGVRATDNPLFFEAGAHLMYTRYSEDVLNFGTENKNLFSLNIPLTVTYKIAVYDTAASVAPYAGLNLKGNIYGFSNRTSNLMSTSQNYRVVEGGWHAGVRIFFSKVYFALGYEGYFTPLCNGTKEKGWKMTLGFEL